MKTKFKQLLIAMSVLAVLVVLPAAVKADPITFTLDDNRTIAQGTSGTFFGTLTNGADSDNFINGLDITFAFGGPGSITFNTDAFFANVPQMFPANSNTGLVAFFDAIVSSLVPPGVYSGSVSVLGGVDDDDDNILGTQEFSITVVPGGQQPIPEPATMLLLGSGLAGAAALKRRKRRNAPTT